MTAIRVELELDDGSFTTRMMRAGQSIESFERQAGGGIRSINALQTSSQSFIGTLRDVTVVLGQASAAISFVRSATTGWASEIIKVNAEFERLKVLLAGMSKAADPMKEANEQLRAMRDFAKTTPYSLQAITNVFTQMKSAGIEPTIKSVKGLTDAVASFGGSEEVLKRAALAMSQMSGKGVIQMEELRQQLGEAVPRAAELMARSMGVTVPQLVKAISTGTVEAKRGLELLNAEMERTFGGAASQQMNTWNGLMSQLSTGMQTLAAGTGDAGFFEAAKKGARDLIALMESPSIKGLFDKQGNLIGNGLAQNVGEGLSKVVTVIDGVIRKVIEFRSEIMAAGEVFVYAFGAAKAFQALNGMATFFNTAATQVGVLRRELAAAGEAMTLAGIAFQGAGTRAEGFRQVAGGAMLATRAIAVAAVELVPVLAVVGAAVMAAASYFDLFGEKAAKAREDVKKFGGAASDESFANFKAQIDAQSKALDALIAKRNKLNGQSPAGNGNRRGAGDVVFGGQINEAQKKLAEDSKLYSDAYVVREQDAADRAAQVRIRALEVSTQQQRRALDQQGRADAQAQEEKLARAAKEKRSTEQLMADYAKQEKERQLQVLDVQINADQKAYDNALELSKSLTGEKLAQEQAFIDQLGRKLDQEKKAREAAAATPINVPFTSKQVDEQRLIDKGQKALENIQAQTVGLRAGLAGASVEVYELQQRLADGKFGPVDNGKVQELIQQLLAAQAEKSKLDELFDGKQKFDKDLASLKLKSEQDLFEAQNRNLTELEKFQLKIRSGAYAGVGPTSSPAERAMIAQRIATVATGDAVGVLAQRIREELGIKAVSDVEKLTGTVEKLNGALKGAGTAAGGINLPQIAGAVTGAGSTGALPGGNTDVVNKDLSAAARVFLNAISGPESAGRYNIRYGGVGSPGKTFDSYDQHPGIMEMRADGRRSSAAGRYQFTKSTWDAMGGGDFSPANQDKRAWELAQQSYKRNTGEDLEKELRTNGFSEKIVQALQGTWEALTTGAGAEKSRKIWASQWDKMGDSNNVQRDTTYRPVRREDPKLDIPSEGLSPEKAREFETIAKNTQKLNAVKLDNSLSDTIKDLKLNFDEASARADGFGKHVSAVRKLIADGKLGDDRNPDAERYKEAITWAEKADKADEQKAKNQKDRARLTAAEERRARDTEELDLRAAALKRQAANGTNVDLSDSYYRKAAEAERDLEAARRLKDSGDKDMTEDKISALASAQAANLAQLRNQEVLEMQQAEVKKTQAVEREVMTADQARQKAFDDEQARQNALVALTTEGSEARAAAEINAQKRMAAERAKLNASSPLAKQAKEWADLGNNMEKAMTGWLDSGVDAIADFVTTGKADFASLFSSIAKDITKMGLKYMLSQAFGGGQGGGLKSMLGGAGGAGKGAAGGAGKSAASAGGGAKMFGAMHTGGIVGAGFSMSRTVNPSIFGSAPRFHTGGIIGADEVPIIAQRGEGVFTREQMKAMGGANGGGNVITLAPAITLNAAGGTPEQNADLAKQTAGQMHEQLRGLVQKELAQQLRPGNMLN